MGAGFNQKGKVFLLLFIDLFMFAVLLVILGTAGFCLFKAQRWTSITYELGTAAETDLQKYLYGSKVALKKGVLDTSEVDYMTVGEYKATISFEDRVYSFDISIEDTVAPVIELREDPGDINIGIDYGYDLLFNSITDLSGEVNTTVTIDGKACDVLFFPNISDYTIFVKAEDINGNVSTEEFVIHAVDTLAPNIVQLEKYPYYGVSDSYELADFVEEISDNSSSFKTRFTVNGKEEKGSFVFNEAGTYSIVIVATDEVGNESTATISVNADYRPELYGVSNKTVKVNTEYNLLEGVLAWDNEEGFISERVMIDGTVDMTVVGTYPITYYVTDQNGLMQQVAAEITVSANSYKTNNAEYPDDLLDKLLDAGAFQYELLKEPNWDLAAELMYPCQLALSTTKFMGSGFIYAIDSKYIYIGTMGHCTYSSFSGVDVDLYFYNPTYDSKMSHKSTKRCISVKVSDCERVYANYDDRAIFTVSIDQIPVDMLIYLKEINKTNESNVSVANGIYTDTIYVAKDMYTGQFKKSFTVFNKSGPGYDTIFEYYPGYKTSPDWLLTNEGGVSGQSGSLLYDGYGNPLASLSGRLYYGSDSIGRHMYISKYRELYEKLLK